MNGYKIGKHQGAKQFVMGNLQLSGKFNDRNAGSHALIAASGDYHHRKLAAAHARIRRGGGIGAGLVLYVAAELGKQHAPHVCAPIAS